MKISSATSTTLLVLLFFLLAVSVAEAQQEACESLISGSISVAGASAVERLATAWVDAYTETCGDVIDPPNVVIEAGGSSDGASRACGTSLSSDPIDIGGMTRPLTSGEATTENGFEFDCARSTRRLLQVEVASEGIAAATSIEGSAATCIKILDGLTLDQLRWIFSSYTDQQLMESGWDANSVPYSDNDPNTHLWSEINNLCPEEEIKIAFPEKGALLFKELIFRGVDEAFAIHRDNATLISAQSNQDLRDYILENDSAITYFELAHVIAEVDQELVSLVPIQEDGHAIKPGAASFDSGTYPLARRIYMNLFHDDASLEATRALMEFGFSSHGDQATKSVGFWPIDRWEKVLMATRIQSRSGIPIGEIEDYCNEGVEEETITIAGSSTVFPVAQIWSEIYRIGCPQVSFVVDGGGSSVGAGRVCGNPEHGTPVDIGDMSRQWKDKEAEVVNGHLYNCKEPGGTSRSVIQVDVAIDGLTVAVKEGGTAWKCIQTLGALTVDQLRWIYSDYNDAQLEETGWDPSSLKNSDRNSQTHLWSELDERCPRVEIRIAGADDLSGTYEYFLETVLVDHDNGETFDLNRPGFGYENSAVDEDLVAYVQQFAESISYFGYSYYFANRDAVSAVAITNIQGEAVFPDPTSIGDGTYNPLARRIYMNLFNNGERLAHTAPFVTFGLRTPSLVEATGYVALPSRDAENMIDRMDSPGSLESTSDGAPNAKDGCIFTVLVPWICVWLIARDHQ
ncbi:phosphate binding protein [Seminavis robusta]|uniref:Phosphate binding protein n=1 Tax=Seminavis robusta TaxID=568900 RepID=A0A9N8HRF4_9STRA|nr:phosphate binding protein [Seminavis robusta]|eukprot:Sro1266_g257570.1 phosphate binding protein (741) ;mRNA; f:16290-18733